MGHSCGSAGGPSTPDVLSRSPIGRIQERSGRSSGLGTQVTRKISRRTSAFQDGILRWRHVVGGTGHGYPRDCLSRPPLFSHPALAIRRGVVGEHGRRWDSRWDEALQRTCLQHLAATVSPPDGWNTVALDRAAWQQIDPDFLTSAAS